MTLKFDLNENTDHLTSKYLVEKRLRINDVWTSNSAGEIQRSLAKSTNYSKAHYLDGHNQVLSDDDFNAMAKSERNALHERIYQQAAQGVGFLYGRARIPEETGEILSEVFKYINQQEIINLIKKITGNADIILADAQATRYTQGDFLTRHNDVSHAEARRIAYVFGFTPNWHPDCGGLLQFYRPDGKPKDTWSPQFNTLDLFDVTHVHAVTHVAPYQQAPRHSITGWFKTA